MPKRQPRRSRQESSFDDGIAARLRATRIASGLSQGEVGARLGVTAQQVQKYETGASRVSASMLFALAKVFEKPVSYFYQTSPDQGEDDALRMEKQVRAFARTKEGMELFETFQKIKTANKRHMIITFLREITRKG